MSNAVETTRPRRARTAAGSVPPQIALDVARVAACSSWTADLLDCCTAVSAGNVSTHLLPVLTTKLTRPLEDVLLPALSLYIRTHLDTHSSPDAALEPDSIALSMWLADEQIIDGLHLAYTTAVAAASLDATIADTVAAGMDGELISWEVINRESVKHEGLINKECNRLARTIPDRSPDDLKGYGWAGLRMALRNYDPALGNAFSTYACPKINGAIRDGARAESHIPKRLTTFVRKVSQAEEKLTQQLGRAPRFEEIAAFLDESMDAMALLPRLAQSASIEELSNPWGEKTREPACLIERLAPEDEVMTAMRNRALRDAVDALPDEESAAVRMLMLEEMPVGEAAAQLGIKSRQLRARTQRGLRALEPVMRAWVS